jgi:ABC-type phosphate/phosphonate transport system permease subunit
MNAQWFGIWQQMQPAVKRALVHRERGSEIAEKAVVTGAVVAVGIGMMLAFNNGLGTFFTTLLTRITAMVP